MTATFKAFGSSASRPRAEILGAGIIATFAASAGAYDLKIDIISGIPAGHQVRCTSTNNSGGSIDETQTAGQNGRVSFQKHDGYNDIYYMDLNTGKIVCDMGTNGGTQVVDLIQIGDLFPLFAAGGNLLTTTIDLTHTVQGLGLNVGDIVQFSGGLAPSLPGMRVLIDGAPFSGAAQVGGFNTVAPEPGVIPVLVLGGVVAARRRT